MSCISNTATHLVNLQEQASLLRVVGICLVVSTLCSSTFSYNLTVFLKEIKNCHFYIFIQFLAVGITLSSALGIGISQGFSLITSVTFINSNVTTLEEPLDEEQISWLGNEQNMYCFFIHVTLYLKSPLNHLSPHPHTRSLEIGILQPEIYERNELEKQGFSSIFDDFSQFCSTFGALHFQNFIKICQKMKKSLVQLSFNPLLFWPLPKPNF